MRKILLNITIMIIFTASVFGQGSDLAELKNNSLNSGNPLGTQPASSPFSLLDASRIKWSHSYSVSFFSGGSSSGSLGYLNSTMLYEFSPKLTLAVNLGILHNAGAIWGDGNNSASFLPGFRLDWRPSEKFSMSVSVQKYSGYYSPYNRRQNYDPLDLTVPY